ncbi:MAG: BLUF domain-containing protein [Roseovarius sp.]
MPLYSLTYCSRVADPAMVSVADILATSRMNNGTRSITGALMFDNRCFLQVLEGGHTALTELFVRIAQDRRHEEVTLLSMVPVMARRFPGWEMHYISRLEADQRMIEAFSTQGRFNPFAMSPATVEALIDRQAKMAATAA